jgi:hypothetical protein
VQLNLGVGPVPPGPGTAWLPGVVPGEVPPVYDVTLPEGGQLAIEHYRTEPGKPDEVFLYRDGLPYPLRIPLGRELTREQWDSQGSSAGLYTLGVSGLPAGRWTLESRVGGVARRQEIEIRAGERTNVDLSRATLRR